MCATGSLGSGTGKECLLQSGLSGFSSSLSVRPEATRRPGEFTSFHLQYGRCVPERRTIGKRSAPRTHSLASFRLGDAAPVGVLECCEAWLVEDAASAPFDAGDSVEPVEPLSCGNARGDGGSDASSS